MTVVYFPPWDGGFVGWALVASLGVPPLLYLTERLGLGRLGYGKFVDGAARRTVPSRIGMCVLYLPSLVLCPLVFVALGHPGTVWHYLVMGMISLHFTKRLAEVLFVHRYSGVMNVSAVVVSSAVYTSTTVVLAGIAALLVPATLVESGAFTPWYRLGVTAFCVGLVGNAYHHRVLATLRPSGGTGYGFPRRGLFRWVSCPHYLFEVVTWLGLALVFHHVAAWIALGGIAGYLAARSDTTRTWYREHMGASVPAGWKRVVPLLY